MRSFAESALVQCAHQKRSWPADGCPTGVSYLPLGRIALGRLRKVRVEEGCVTRFLIAGSSLHEPTVRAAPACIDSGPSFSDSSRATHELAAVCHRFGADFSDWPSAIHLRAFATYYATQPFSQPAMARLALLFSCVWTSAIQCCAVTPAQWEPPTTGTHRMAANATRTSYSLVACYESLGASRPLSEMYWSCSISECMNWASGYTYFGFGCPVGNCFECRRGNSIGAPSAVLGCQECGGQATVVNHCTGTAVVNYNGVDWLMGGWHREPVYTQGAPGSQAVFCPAVMPTATPTPDPTPSPTSSPTLTTPDPTPSPTSSPTPSPTAATPSMGGVSTGSISAVGDPHLQNVYGQRFDLMRPGRHVLINI
ncbi:unnamed protein product [Prorocentrum cordatum]|uniref:Uncharacterized protein n=1 Tax=Prorocentrum cordatum TaxID=2364126 RepID=A0ABN9SKI2_9DINO|nr:unnamed protein product [Polarella glacialis]